MLPLHSKPTPSHVFFSGAAWGCGFYVGVYRALQELYGLNALQNVKFGGNSTGAMIALSCALGIGWEESEKILLSLITDGVENGVLQKLSIYEDRAMDTVFINDRDLYKKVNDRLFIGVTTWFDKYELISKWNNNKELRDCLHCSMHIPYYCTYLEKIRCNDGEYRRGIDGGCGKQFHIFGKDTLVVITIKDHLFNDQDGDIMSDTPWDFKDCMKPDLERYYKMRDNGYKMMMNWNGKYKCNENNDDQRIKNNKTKVMRNIAVMICWMLRILEEIKIKRIVMLVLTILLYKRYRNWIVYKSLE